MDKEKILMRIEDDKTWGDCIWIDEDYLEHYKNTEGMKWGFCGRPYDGLVLGFGENIFVFSLDASPIINKTEVKK